MIIDLKEKQFVNMMPSGVVGQISFKRLIDQLRRAGEFNAGELVTHLSIDLTGISYRIEFPNEEQRK